MKKEDDSLKIFADFVNGSEGDFAWLDQPISQGDEIVVGSNDVSWEVRRVEGDAQNLRRIEADGVSVIHTKNDQFEYLTWKATLPDFIIPGRSTSLVPFEHLFFYSIPKRLGAELPSEDDAIDAFRRESKVQLGGRDRPPKEYDFFRIGDYHRFVADFLKPDKGYVPQSMRVSPKRRNHNTSCNLVISFGQFDCLEGEIGIHLSRGQSGAPWTEGIVSWALETHRKGSELAGDSAAASKLLQVIKGT